MNKASRAIARGPGLLLAHPTAPSMWAAVRSTLSDSAYHLEPGEDKRRQSLAEAIGGYRPSSNGGLFKQSRGRWLSDASLSNAPAII
jgi:hypothetical protein